VSAQQKPVARQCHYDATWHWFCLQYPVKYEFLSRLDTQQTHGKSMEMLVVLSQQIHKQIPENIDRNRQEHTAQSLEVLSVLANIHQTNTLET
jgi:hypothetical protein